MLSFAAAAVSGGDPIRTGFVAFFYSLRTALLPFLFEKTASRIVARLYARTHNRGA